MADRPYMDWDAYKLPTDPKGLEWESPNSLEDKMNCALMVMEKAKKDIGAKGAKGNVRHKGIELYLGQEEPTLMDASRVAARIFADAGLSEEDMADAIKDIRKIPVRSLPKFDTIISLEGSNLPDNLTRVLYGRKMLHVIIRDKPGPWGPPYGIRMVIDCITIDEDGEEQELPDWKGRNPLYKDNDIQAILNFLALAAPGGLNEAWGLKPKKITWTAVGIPTMIRDPHVFHPEEFEAYRSIIDNVRAVWQERKVTKPATPGRHCGDCQLANSARCPASKDVSTPVAVEGVELKAGEAAKWSDENLVKGYQLLKTRFGQIKALMDPVEEEVKRRAKLHMIGPPGQRYVVSEVGSSGIEWDQAEVLGLLAEILQVPVPKMAPELAEFLGFTGGKTMMVDLIKSKARGDKKLKDHWMDRFERTYEQGTYEKLSLKPCAENVPAVKPEPEVKAINGKTGKAATMEGHELHPAECSACSSTTTQVFHTKDATTRLSRSPDTPEPPPAPLEAYAQALGVPPPEDEEPFNPVEGLESGSCKSCGATIYWGKTHSGKPCPFDADGKSHFSSCPQASQHSKKAKKEQASA